MYMKYTDPQKFEKETTYDFLVAADDNTAEPRASIIAPKYFDFLKSKVFLTKPDRVASIQKKTERKFSGVPMVVVYLDDNIEDPTREVIAISKVNGESLIVWGDSVYALAFHKFGDPNPRTMRTFVIYKIEDYQDEDVVL